MPAYIVTLKDSATDQDVADTKKAVIDQGGKITQEYTIIKGFAVEYPEDCVSALESDPRVEAVERDGEVTTQ